MKSAIYIIFLFFKIIDVEPIKAKNVMIDEKPKAYEKSCVRSVKKPAPTGPMICPSAKIMVILLNILAVFSMPKVSAVKTAMIEGIAQTEIPNSEAEIQRYEAGTFKAIMIFAMLCIKKTMLRVFHLPILSDRIPKSVPENILKNPSNIQKGAETFDEICHLSMLANTKNVT